MHYLRARYPRSAGEIMREVLGDINTYCHTSYCCRLQRHEVYRNEDGYFLECARCYLSRPAISSELSVAWANQQRLREAPSAV